MRNLLRLERKQKYLVDIEKLCPRWITLEINQHFLHLCKIYHIVHHSGELDYLAKKEHDLVKKFSMNYEFIVEVGIYWCRYVSIRVIATDHMAFCCQT